MPLRVLLTQAKVSLTPCAKGVPTSLVPPDRSIRWPSGIDCAPAAIGSAIAAAIAHPRMCFRIVMSCSLPWWSVRIGVELPVGLDQLPTMGNAVRLKDQEQDDGRPDRHLPQE